MYNAKFISDNGVSYLFGAKGKTAFSMDVGSGISVDLGTSQGFLQVGEFVNSQSIRGKNITVTGAVYGNVEKKKNELRKAFAPFTSGKLVFNDTHYIRVYVQSTPSFSAKKGNGKFTMLLYAPSPLFRNVKESVYRVGTTTPTFSFPINYAIPHKFGERASGGLAQIYNDGDVAVPFRAELYFVGYSVNPVITDYNSYKSFKINGDFSAGDFLTIYRNDKNILKVELFDGYKTSDIIDQVDESSTLFEIPVGNSPFVITDNNGGMGIEAAIMFNEAVVSVYES